MVAFADVATTGQGAWTSRFGTLDDIRALGRNDSEADDRAFASAARVSELTPWRPALACVFAQGDGLTAPDEVIE